jgi:uncharacterized membrane protein
MSTTSSGEPRVENSHKRSAPFPGWIESSPWVTLTALVIALIAVAVAFAGRLRLAHVGAAPAFAAQQTSQAKGNVCSAYTNVHSAVVINTHLNSPNPNDPTGRPAVAANARLALLGGGGYLQDRLVAESASPADLANAVKSMANTIEQLGTAYLADVGSILLDPLRRNLDADISQINELCRN